VPYHVRIDELLCNGHGNCIVAAPQIFDLDPATNVATVVSGRVTDEDGPALVEAESDCPARAISLRRT
jgi:ferredoxin